MVEIVLKSDIDFEVINQVGDDLAIAKAAWVASGKDAIDADEKKIAGLLDFLIEHRHGTPFEHGFVTVRVNAPIKVWREWHRHRIGMSYNEQSGRYSKLAPVFYVSPPHRPMFRNEPFKPSRPKFLTIAQATEDGFQSADYTAELAYQRYLQNQREVYSLAYTKYEENYEILKLDPGLARDGLGVGIYSACYVSFNPRSLMNFLSLRTHEPKALKVSFPLWEIELAARQVESVLKQFWPITHAAFNKARIPQAECLFNRYAP